MKYLLCFLLLLSVGAMDVAGLKELAKERGVASERHWLNLLHYDKGFFSEASVVDDDKFFLSPQGKYNPEAELEACLEAFSRGLSMTTRTRHNEPRISRHHGPAATFAEKPNLGIALCL